ncbi:hypothetical protein C8R44DRAFT_989746 [Mycena epipterygia]|nr:hypothetical protein C8R44DRAFT_989746 [Mycena epipterygia]
MYSHTASIILSLYPLAEAHPQLAHAVASTTYGSPVDSGHSFAALCCADTRLESQDGRYIRGAARIYEPLVDHALSIFGPVAILRSRPHPALAPSFPVRKILLRSFRLERQRCRNQGFRCARSARALQAFTRLVGPAPWFPAHAAVPHSCRPRHQQCWDVPRARRALRALARGSSTRHSRRGPATRPRPHPRRSGRTTSSFPSTGCFSASPFTRTS